MNASYLPPCKPVRTSLNQDRSEDAGFNRVDLLTVLGGLALLGLLLTPALARTRVTDQGMQCRNNLRQLIQAWQMYADENGGKLPNCFDWVGGWLNYSANNPDNTNFSYLVNGLLGPYVKNPAVYKCPADMSQGLEGAVRRPRVRSVSMSQAFTQYGSGALDTSYRHYVKFADMGLPAPANLWVLMDEHPDSINDCAFAVTLPASIWQDAPSILHDGGCDFAFADGHSDIKRWTDPRTLALKVTYTTTFAFGINQPNNPDIKWLQDRSTAPK
jgi:prepilin-type processing-associated H-X9-DG protein